MAGFVNLHGQNLNIGIKIQKTHSMYWENGISARYSFSNFKSDQFYLGFDYISSRFGSAFNSNALKQDSYVASAAWHFAKEKPLRFVTKLNFGYFYADLEEDIFKELPNTAILLSPEFGLSYDFKNIPIILYLGTAYNINVVDEGKSPGTLQPLFYNFAIYYQLF